MPVGRISRSIAQAERGKQGVPSFDVGKVGASVGGNSFNALDYPNCAGWWDINQINASPGTLITHLPDLSGLGKHIIEVQAPPGPSFVLINGVPALFMDGVKTTLQFTLGTMPVPWTMFVVCQNLQSTDDNADHAIWGVTGTFINMLHIDNITNNLWTFDPSAGAAIAIPSALVSPLDTTRRLWVVQARADNTQAIRSNGVQVATGTSAMSGSNPTGSGAIGSHTGTDRLWNGYWHEQVCYLPGVNDTQVVEIEKKMCRKWGITIPKTGA